MVRVSNSLKVTQHSGPRVHLLISSAETKCNSTQNMPSAQEMLAIASAFRDGDLWLTTRAAKI